MLIWGDIEVTKLNFTGLELSLPCICLKLQEMKFGKNDHNIQQTNAAIAGEVCQLSLGERPGDLCSLVVVRI